MRGGTRLLACGIDHPHSWGKPWADGDYSVALCSNCGATKRWKPGYETETVRVMTDPSPKLPVLNIVTAIPPEVEQYAEDIRRFVDAMVYKLSVHADKGRWENMPIGKAEELLKGEVEELTEAIERGNLVEILLEAADVGNYALIISAIAIEKGK